MKRLLAILAILALAGSARAATIFAECSWEGADILNSGGPGGEWGAAYPDDITGQWERNTTAGAGWNGTTNCLHYNITGGDGATCRYTYYNHNSVGVRFAFRLHAVAAGTGEIRSIGSIYDDVGGDADSYICNWEILRTGTQLQLEIQTTVAGGGENNVGTWNIALDTWYQVSMFWQRNTVNGLSAKLYNEAGTQQGSTLTLSGTTTNNPTHNWWLGDDSNVGAGTDVYWDIFTADGAADPGPKTTGCTAATITRHATILDTLGNAAKKFGHVVANAFDSVNFATTTLDSVAMLTKTTKDTIVYRAKKKAGKTVLVDTIYSCAGVSKNECFDTLQFVGPSVAYAGSPYSGKVGFPISLDVTSTDMADSFTTVATLPAGLTLTKSGANLGRVSGTPTAASGATDYRIVVWRKGSRSDSVNLNITVAAATQFNLTMAGAHSASTTPSIGAHAYDSNATVNISHVANPGYRFWKWSKSVVTSPFGDSTQPATTIIVKSAVTATVNDSIIHYSLTMANDAHSTSTPAAGVSSVDSFATTAIANIGAAGYRFWKWTRSSINAVITDSSLASTNVALKANATVTSNDTIIHYAMTNANDGHGTFTPATGPQDSGVVFNIDASPLIGYRFSSWTPSSGNVVIANTGLKNTTAYLKAAGTITLADTIIHYTMTNANDGHGTFTPATGLHDTANSFNIVATAAQGYRFWKWTRSGITVVITDSSLASTSAYLKAAGTITLNDTTMKVILTMVNSTPAGTISPLAGVNVEDSGAVVSLTYTAPQGYRFFKWGRSNTFAVFGVGANDSSHSSATVYLKDASTITAACTTMKAILTVASARGTPTPTVGAHVVDSGATTNLGYTAASNRSFWKLSRGGLNAVFSDSSIATGTVYLKADATITFNDTITLRPGKPTLISPANNATNVSITPLVNWRKP